MEFILDKVTIDESVFGISAVDKDGNESLVSAYTMAPRRKSTCTIKQASPGGILRPFLFF